jgi:hypothetical protein
MNLAAIPQDGAWRGPAIRLYVPPHSTASQQLLMRVPETVCATHLTVAVTDATSGATDGSLLFRDVCSKWQS